MRENHGGANFAKTTGTNRKASVEYDRRSVDYDKLAAQSKIGNGSRDSNGFTKPGSRKKVY